MTTKTKTKTTKEEVTQEEPKSLDIENVVINIDSAENSQEKTILHVFDKTIVIPKSWEDIDKDYLLAFVESIRLGIQVDGMLSYTLIKATGIESILKKNLSIETESEKETILSEVYRASESLSFMLGENELAFGLVDNIKGLFTPKKGLSDFKMLEYIVANQFISSFAQSGKVEDLDCLCATLLRNRSKGVRIPFSDAEHEFMLKQVKMIDVTTKLAIMKMYEGEMLRLTKLYPLCFSGSNGDKSFPYDLITSVAGDKFGTVAQVEQTEVHIVLQYLEKSIAESNKANSNGLE